MVNEYLGSMFSLEGKTALITGAAGAIGGAMSIAFAKAGAKVALTDINMEGLQKIHQAVPHSTKTFRLDVTEMDSFPGMVKEIADWLGGRIDILVNCAGINKREGFVDVIEETYDKIMDTDLKGPFFLSKAVAPYMKAQNDGVVINIGSHNTGSALGGSSVYGAAKSGLMALTRSMATEWAKYNIRANCVSPGHINTPFTTTTWEHPVRSQFLLDRIALDRAGKPEDITGICLFLASNAAAYITGSEFRVDGGCMSGGKHAPYDTEF